MTGGRTHCKRCVCLQTRIYALLLRRSHGARYLFAMLLSAMPNEILALQAHGWLFPAVLPAWSHCQRRHSLKSPRELHQSYFWSFGSLLDPSAGSEEMLTVGALGKRDLLHPFLPEQSMHAAKRGPCLPSSKALVPWASILHMCSWAAFQSKPVAHGRQKPGQADRIISLGSSPERHNAHVALTRPSLVPTGLAHSG